MVVHFHSFSPFLSDFSMTKLPIIVPNEIFEEFSMATKLMKYHFYANDLSPNQIAGKIGVHPFFIKQYQQASKYYSKGKLANILSELRYYDLASKGVYSTTISDEELLKELVYKVMH